MAIVFNIGLNADDECFVLVDSIGWRVKILGNAGVDLRKDIANLVKIALVEIWMIARNVVYDQLASG